MMTDAPRSHSPDIELGTRGLGFVISRLVKYQLTFSSQPLHNLPEAPINHPQIPVPAFIYQATPSTLLFTMPISNHP